MWNKAFTSRISVPFYPEEVPEYFCFSRYGVPFAIPHQTKAEGIFKGKNAVGQG